MIAGFTIPTIAIAALLAFCRIGGCFLLMPGLSSARVPMQIRLFVALAATGGLLIHLWDQIVPFASREPEILAPMVLSELLIGGLIVQVIGFSIAVMVAPHTEVTVEGVVDEGDRMVMLMALLGFGLGSVFSLIAVIGFGVMLGMRAHNRG